MIRKWIIVEDRPRNAGNLLEAFAVTLPPADDSITWLWPSGEDAGMGSAVSKIVAELKEKRGIQVHTERVGSISEVFERCNQLAGDNTVFLFDLDFRNLGRLDASASDDFAKLLTGAGGCRAILFYSADASAPSIRNAVQDRLNPELKKLVRASNEEATKPVNSRKIIKEALECMQSCDPLSHFWAETQLWYGKNSAITHELSKMPIELYRDEVDRVLGFTTPDAWWGKEKGNTGTLTNMESVHLLHFHLKHLCGVHYCGSGRDKNLTLGGVFILALMAQCSLAGSIGVLETPFQPSQGESGKSWSAFPNTMGLFLARQEPDDARETAKALYQLFRLIFEVREAEPSSVGSTVRRCQILHRGSDIRIGVSWSGQQLDVHGLQDEKSKMICFDPLERSNTVTAFHSLHYYLGLQSAGFRHPGNLYMRRTELVLQVPGHNGARKARVSLGGQE